MLNRFYENNHTYGGLTDIHLVTGVGRVKRVRRSGGSHAQAQGAGVVRVIGAGALSVLLGAPVLAQAQPEQGDRRLDTVVIRGAKQTPAQEARAKVEEVAGGASVVDNAEVERGRASTLEDVLALQPGVLSQSTGGNDAVKISIRGSGANTGAGVFRDGVQFLFDGLSVTGPGGTPYELLEMSGVNHTEVLRGANAFQYGALSLGGAINLVTHTGATSPGNYARFEVGSFGWRKQQLSTGGVTDNGDYYISLANSERDGYQDWTFTKAKGAVANVGYRFSPKLETRLIVRYREEFHENPATLTKSQLNADSSQTNPVSVAQSSTGTKEGSSWVGSKTTYTFDDDATLEFGLVYHNYPQILSEKSTLNPNRWSWRDINTSLRYKRSDELFGHHSDTSLSLTNTRHLRAGVKTYNGVTGQLLKDARYDGSSDSVIALGNELELTERLWLSSGLSLVNIRRDIDVIYSDRVNTSPFPQHYNHDNWSLAPRLGLRYYLTPDIQLFGNLSRSIDPASSWMSSGSGVASNYAVTLVEQKGNTVEFGVRGKHGIFDGSLAIYRSWVKDERLNVEVIPAAPGRAAVTATFNASPTIHQGLEAGLDTRLWESADGAEVILRQAYTFNDFYYENDQRFRSNELPGLPRHVYHAELQWQHPNGLYAGLNLRSVSRTPVDYANTAYAPSYTIFGARAGYEQPDKRWSVFLDLRNLTDKDYATAVQPIYAGYNAAGVEQPGIYAGDGFGAFTGVSFRF